MPSVRSLRRSRGLTLAELALLTGIPTRVLVLIEHDLLPLDQEHRRRLAHIFELSPEMLLGSTAPAHTAARRLPLLSIVHLVAAGLSGMLLVAPTVTPRPPLFPLPPLITPAPAQAPAPPATQQPPTSARHPIAARHLDPGRLSPSPTPAATATPPPTQALPLAPPPTQALPPTLPPTQVLPPTIVLPTATPQPTPTDAPLPTPAADEQGMQAAGYVMLADGPHGCPLAPSSGQIVITQGYGVGTHAPASLWGAIDLGVDTDGDGAAEPDASRGVPILATHAGTARVFPNSWPGGNLVMVEDPESGWTTIYGHLESFAIADGQAVAAGTQLGTTGSTGLASGPHLHYEVRYGGQNLDPTSLIGCNAQ